MRQEKKNNRILQNISQFRTELMGFSILWIYLFHARIWLPDTAMFAPLNTFKEIGYAGVDVFLFLSGFGLMTGMMKNNHDILTFYKKRMLRILPAYWIATSAALVCASVSGKQVADRTHALSSCQERASADWTLYFREHSVWGFASPMRASGVRRTETTARPRPRQTG